MPSKQYAAITVIGNKIERPVTGLMILAMLSIKLIPKIGMMNNNPPIVGVPILVKCVCGPSTRICLPILKRLSRMMNGPPQMTTNKNVIMPSERAKVTSLIR